MKLKTIKEIESLAVNHANFYTTPENHDWHGRYSSYKNSYIKAQEDLVASASESFEEWKAHNLSCHESARIHDLCERSYQAAKLSQAKEIEKRDAVILSQKKERQRTDALWKENEELRKKIENLTGFWKPFIEKLNKYPNIYAPHKVALDALTSAFDVYCDNEGLKKENEKLNERIKKLEFMIENGLGWEDMRSDEDTQTDNTRNM